MQVIFFSMSNLVCDFPGPMVIIHQKFILPLSEILQYKPYSHSVFHNDENISFKYQNGDLLKLMKRDVIDLVYLFK